MNIKLIYTDCGNDKVIAAGTSSEVLAKFEDVLTGIESGEDLARLSLVDADGEPVIKIPGEFYGVICATATAFAALYPIDEDGEPDTCDDPIWETVHTGSCFRCYRSTRYPLTIEHTGYNLFDDQVAACRREWESHAAENGYTHAGGDTWEKDGRKFFLFEDVRTPENCDSTLLNLI